MVRKYLTFINYTLGKTFENDGFAEFIRHYKKNIFCKIYMTSWGTRHCPGHNIKEIKYEWNWLTTASEKHPSRSGWWVQKCDQPQIKWTCSLTFVFYTVLPSNTVEAIESPQPPFGPPDTHIRVKSKSMWLKPDQVDYWEGALQCLFHKMIDHSSRSTWAHVLPSPDFRSKGVLCSS